MVHAPLRKNCQIFNSILANLNIEMVNLYVIILAEMKYTGAEMKYMGAEMKYMGAEMKYMGAETKYMVAFIKENLCIFYFV